MRIGKLGLSMISFSGIFLLHVSIFANYNTVYAQDGNQSTTSSSSSWSVGQPIHTPRSEIAGVALNEKIYIIGGFDETGRSTTNVEVYDPMANKWTTTDPLPQP